MLKSIFECLKLDINSKGECISIARGKNKLPETFREALKPLKQIKWHKK